MRYIKKFENHNDDDDDRVIAYHVTNEKNLKSIFEEGIQPRVPKDYGEKGDIKGVYLFKSREDMVNAIMNWLGERIEEWEEETGEVYNEVEIHVDITGLDYFSPVGYEWVVLETIPPERITKVIKDVPTSLDYIKEHPEVVLYNKK